MTSTLPPDPPNFNGINYNSSFWSNASTGFLTYSQASKNFLQFPVAQGTETLQNTGVNGTLTIINPLTPIETYSQYIDNDPSLDMTLSTNQTAGGLTIRTPSNSFTMNPKTFNINLTTPTPVTGLQMLNPINMANFNIVNMGQYSTAYTQVNNTNQDYVATCNYVNNMIVNGNGILDNNNVWTGINEFQNFVNIGTVNASNYYSQISQMANGALNINNQTPTANFPNTNFKCNNASNVMTTYFSVSPQELDSFTTLNMNTQVINNCSALNGSLGGTLLLGTQQSTYITISAGSLTAGSNIGINSANGTCVFNYYTVDNLSLNLISNNATFFIQNTSGNIMTFSNTEVDSYKNLNMNNNNIINMGSGSTAYTQIAGTGNTTVATTGYVQNLFISQTISLSANNAYYSVNVGFNSFQTSYIILDNNQYLVTMNPMTSTGNGIIITTNSSMPINTVNTITLAFTGGATVPWAPPTSSQFGKVSLIDGNTGISYAPSISISNVNLVITLSPLSYLSPNNTYTIYIQKTNITV